MVSCLNPGTIGGGVSYEEFVDLAQKSGFKAVEFAMEPAAAMMETKGEDQVRAWLEERGIGHAAFWLPFAWRGDEDSFRRGLANLPRLAQAAKAVSSLSCVTYIPPSVEEDASLFLKRSVERFRLVCDVLGEYGIAFGIEWVAPSHLRRSGNPTIWTMNQALDLCDQIGRPNAGLLVDSFHWFVAGHTVSDLLKLRREQVVHCHINDAPDRSLDEQRDNDRLLPGDGIIDLKSFLTTLKRIGYDGAVSVEVLSEKLPKERSKEELARVSAERLNRLLKEVVG